MSDQTEALRLAERLERRRLTRWVHATGETPRASGYVVDQDCAEAAAELRRLHALNAELLEALKQHGAHHGNCDYMILLTSLPPMRKPCSCGLHAAIAKAESK
jgi:hypothetical protein